jgi:hypothetical protein
MNDELKNYLNDIDFLESPLKGLLKADMTNPNELRAFVQKTRLMRESRQSFKAMVVAEEENPTTKTPRVSAFDNFEDEGEKV